MNRFFSATSSKGRVVSSALRRKPEPASLAIAADAERDSHDLVDLGVEAAVVPHRERRPTRHVTLWCQPEPAKSPPVCGGRDHVLAKAEPVAASGLHPLEEPNESGVVPRGTRDPRPERLGE